MIDTQGLGLPRAFLTNKESAERKTLSLKCPVHNKTVSQKELILWLSNSNTHHVNKKHILSKIQKIQKKCLQ